MNVENKYGIESFMKLFFCLFTFLLMLETQPIPSQTPFVPEPNVSSTTTAGDKGVLGPGGAG
jgi:hypothetical protein